MGNDCGWEAFGVPCDCIISFSLAFGMVPLSPRHQFTPTTRSDWRMSHPRHPLSTMHFHPTGTEERGVEKGVGVHKSLRLRTLGLSTVYAAAFGRAKTSTFRMTFTPTHKESKSERARDNRIS